MNGTLLSEPLLKKSGGNPGASWDLIGLMKARGDIDDGTGIGIDYQTTVLLGTLETDIKAVAFLLLLSIILAGIGTAASAATIFLPLDKHADEPGIGSAIWVKVNFAVAACAFFVLFLAACIGTGASQGAAEKININMREVGIRAVAGKKWPGLAWSATCIMALQLIYYVDQIMIIYDRVCCGTGRDYFRQPFPERQLELRRGVSRRGE